MTAKELREYLNSGELDFEFEYRGKEGTICLCYLPSVYVFYDGIETEINMERLMNFPFLDGETLEEACEEIKFYG